MRERGGALEVEHGVRAGVKMHGQWLWRKPCGCGESLGLRGRRETLRGRRETLGGRRVTHTVSRTRR